MLRRFYIYSAAMDVRTSAAEFLFIPHLSMRKHLLRSFSYYLINIRTFIHNLGFQVSSTRFSSFGYGICTGRLRVKYVIRLCMTVMLYHMVLPLRGKLLRGRSLLPHYVPTGRVDRITVNRLCQSPVINFVANPLRSLQLYVEPCSCLLKLNINLKKKGCQMNDSLSLNL